MFLQRYLIQSSMATKFRFFYCLAVLTQSSLAFCQFLRHWLTMSLTRKGNDRTVLSWVEIGLKIVILLYLNELIK